MRPLVRLGLIVAAAGGFLLALSLTASADVVEPSSAYQPASTALIQNGPGAAALPTEEKAATGSGEASQPTETRDAEVAATPAPEHQVKPVPAHITHTSPTPQGSALDRAVRPLGVGLERIGAYLGRVVSTCQVAAGSGAGVPVLALAVLCVVTALNRRRVFGTRPSTDEDVPELLYATEVIAPG